MKPRVRRNCVGRSVDKVWCCHSGDISYIATSQELLEAGGTLYWFGWGSTAREAYLDWCERVTCTYAKYDDEECVCKECSAWRESNNES